MQFLFVTIFSCYEIHVHMYVLTIQVRTTIPTSTCKVVFLFQTLPAMSRAVTTEQMEGNSPPRPPPTPQPQHTVISSVRKRLSRGHGTESSDVNSTEFRLCLVIRARCKADMHVQSSVKCVTTVCIRISPHAGVINSVADAQVIKALLVPSKQTT